MGASSWNPTANDVRRILLVACVIFVGTTCLLVARMPVPQSLWREHRQLVGPCAIALYGLPRSFKNLVLPSLIRNVIQPNAIHRCDYFVYFHESSRDPGGRDDRSGNIDTREVWRLQDAVQKYHVSRRLPSVTIDSFTDEAFQKTRMSLLQTIRLSKDSRGKHLFLPYNHPSYSNISVENVVKMWHAQEAVWNMLDDVEPTDESSGNRKHYSRVAMLRIDVVYLTPIDVYQLPNKTLDYENSVAVIPNFARHPVNDRMMYGPYEALQVWASQRTRRLAQHGQYIDKYAPGDGIHSERFLNSTIFPAIRQRGVSIETHPDICFLRARADGAVRLTDCGTRHTTRNNYLAVLSLLRKHCSVNMTHANRSVVLLECEPNEDQNIPKAAVHVEWHHGCFIDEKPPPRKKRSHVKPCLPPHVSMFKRVHEENVAEMSGYGIL